MAGRRGAIPAVGDNREQEEAEEITVLSPRTSRHQHQQESKPTQLTIGTKETEEAGEHEGTIEIFPTKEMTDKGGLMMFHCDNTKTILKKTMKFGRMGKKTIHEVAMSKETSGTTMMIFEWVKLMEGKKHEENYKEELQHGETSWKLTARGVTSRPFVGENEEAIKSTDSGRDDGCSDKELKQETTWKANSTRKQTYSSRTNEQPSKSVLEKRKDVDTQDAAKKKENKSKGKSQNTYTRPSLKKCFRCGQSGHLSNNCPQRKTIALAHEESNSISEDDKEEDEEAKFIEADDGDRISCVIQRVLIAKEETNPKWHNIFKMRCTINGRVCDVIINSESSQNFVARKLVTILNLKTDPHPNPYKIGWVRKGGEASINEICTVPLSIGSGYKDQIVRDIIEIDVCHLLLGRPMAA
ncbi:hypothetical protein E5676_scaffold278G00510 [Cucumis melo var. makuwa]|uniref:CCHC-type domain-containing protein n=1 Tax=Cucumis melo var. makuwa TaxID=1194695 RepID=A0A5D3DJB8_CUCMM|nr:hypothetical protein E6C27_scaffold262G00150 [Cucumis melo var. makuwa]TYK23480.1 hypothetical protein E5676_scaffold278G00510 [Cucumis melo var. makuwa]